MIRRTGVFVLWGALLLIAKWSLEHMSRTDERQSVILMEIVMSVVGLILCLPLLVFERYRNRRFMVYCVLSLVIGVLVTNAWWLGQAAGIASLFLSIPALILEDAIHSWLFGKRQGHGIWALLVLHCAMLLPLNPTVRNFVGMGLEDALFLGVFFPVTIWRCVGSMLCVINPSELGRITPTPVKHS